MPNQQIGNPQYGGLLSPEDYNELQQINQTSNDRLSHILSTNGVSRFTVCPYCRVDDFSHREKCPLIPKNT